MKNTINLGVGSGVEPLFEGFAFISPWRFPTSLCQLVNVVTQTKDATRKKKCLSHIVEKTRCNILDVYHLKCDKSDA